MVPILHDTHLPLAELRTTYPQTNTLEICIHNGDCCVLGHVWMSSQRWLWTVIPVSAFTVTPKEKKKEAESIVWGVPCTWGVFLESRPQTALPEISCCVVNNNSYRYSYRLFTDIFYHTSLTTCPPVCALHIATQLDQKWGSSATWYVDRIGRREKRGSLDPWTPWLRGLCLSLLLPLTRLLCTL